MAEISIRSRLPRDVAWIVAVACVLQSVLLVVVYGFGADSHAYWLVWRESDLYSRVPNADDAYLYSPAFAQAIWPLAQLPWPVFCAVFTVAPAAAFVWLLRPLPVKWFVPAWLMTTPEIVTGNVYWLLALAAVVGLRVPAVWVAMALTKITPCLGPLWFLVRREWGRFAVSILVTAAVTALSYATWSAGWHAWYEFLRESLDASRAPLGSPILPPLVLRLPVAVAIVVWGARTGRAVALPVAMVVATPVIGTASFTMLAAIPRLVAHRPQDCGGRRSA